MGKFYRAFRLSPSDFSKLTLLTFLLFGAALKILFSSQQSLIENLQPDPRMRPSSRKPEELAPWIRLLEAIDRNIGWKPSCIRRALVLAWLSRAMKIPVQFKVGIRRDGDVFEAHTWLEAEGLSLEIQPTGAVFLPLQKVSS